MKVSDAIQSRRSVRAFKNTPVPRTTVDQIIEIACRAPSSSNVQPWQVYALDGEKLKTFCDIACVAHNAIRNDPELAKEYRAGHTTYPTKWESPYLERRRQNGWSLYNLLGIAKGDSNRMHEQHQQNYRFFGAPTGLFFTIDRSLGNGLLVDHGMFLENVTLLAREFGLETCAIAAWNSFAKLVLEEIGASEREALVCGIAIGYPDEQAVVNTLNTPRVPLTEFFKWVD
jgi:nitroreductase